jgi:hypothetical protein
LLRVVARAATLFVRTGCIRTSCQLLAEHKV